MRYTRSIPIIYFLSFLLFVSAQADARNFSCYVEANNTDVFVEIYNTDRNTDSSERIWLGRLSDGESVRINTSDGLMTYYYTTKPGEDEPMKGGLDRLCDNDRTIAIP